MKNFKFRALFLGLFLVVANVSVADKESDAINRFVCSKGVVSACMQYCSKYCNEKYNGNEDRKKCVSENCSKARYCNLALISGKENYPGTLNVKTRKNDIPEAFYGFAENYRECLAEEKAEGKNNKGVYKGKVWQKNQPKRIKSN
tara:strand:+ start:21452 stop:21886 length:435 start_codon:yes stop_codon:yes gene_type:complete